MLNISNFKAEIMRHGVMKNNTFMVSFTPPAGIRGIIQSDRISLRCDSAQIPGVSFATIDNVTQFGYGPLEAIPYNVIFDDITLTFTIDTHGDIHRFFYEWFQYIVNFDSRGQADTDSVGRGGLHTFEVAYKDDYVVDLMVDVYEPAADAGSDTPNKIMTAKAFRAFPKHLPAFDMSWHSTNETVRIQIPFSYTDFNVIYHSR